MQATNFRPIKAIKPTEKLKEFIGKTLIITLDQPEGGTPVVVESIQGSMIKAYQTYFEVNHAYHIAILDAYRQLNGDKSITEEDVATFNQVFDDAVVEKYETPDPLSVKPPSFKDRDGKAVRAIMLMNPYTYSKAYGIDLGTATDPSGNIMPIDLEVSPLPADGIGHMFFGTNFIGSYDFSQFLKEPDVKPTDAS